MGDRVLLFEDFVAPDHHRRSTEPGRIEERLGVPGARWAVAPVFTEAKPGSMTVPVLVLAGAEEEFVRPEHPRRLAGPIPGAELGRIPGAGHVAPIARPDGFDRIVVTFLSASAGCAR